MKNKNSNPKEQGQAIVELATSLVMLLTLLAGVMDLGRALFTYIALRDAAQEGASYASVLETDALGNADIAGYCQEITNRIMITSIGFNGNVSHGPINLEGLVSNGEVSVLTEINGTECSTVAPADICMGMPVSVRVTYGSFPVTMPFMGTILGSQSIPISAVVVDKILTPACQ